MPDEANPSSNAAQIEYWNATAGLTWVEFQEQLDRQIEPLGAEAMRVLAPTPGERILDIGCGCGQTTLQLAARVLPGGAALGADISNPMLGVARARPRAVAGLSVDFKQLDAQSDDLGACVFDAAYSRFGVMFFSDTVAAFANILKALKSGGRFAFVCWRPLQENEWMLEPLQAARHLLPPPAPVDPLAPGPFAFADADRVSRLLREAGFGSVEVRPYDAMIGAGDMEQSLRLALKVGPLGAALRENPQLRDDVSGVVREVLAKHLTPQGIRMHAAVWIFLARKR